MEKCQDFLKELADYIDGDAAAEVCAAFERHMAHCESCRLVVDNIKQSVTLVCRDKEKELPAEIQRNLHECLKKRWSKLQSEK